MELSPFVVGSEAMSVELLASDRCSCGTVIRTHGPVSRYDVDRAGWSFERVQHVLLMGTRGYSSQRYLRGTFSETRNSVETGPWLSMSPLLVGHVI